MAPKPTKKTRKKKKTGKAGTRSEPDETFVVDTLDQLRVLTHPLRQRVLERFALGPRTTKQVADQLGEKPTRLYHHVAALERAGFVELVETRPKRGTTEKYFTAVARRIRIDPELLAGEGLASSVKTAGLEVVDGLLTNLRGELAELVAAGDESELPEEEVLFMQVEVHGEARAKQVREMLEGLVGELMEDADACQDPNEEGEAYRLFLGWYPLPKHKS